MPYRFPLITLLLLAGFTVTAAAAQTRPYAPKAPLPESPITDSFLQMEIRSVEAAEVPNRSDVEAPPYPGGVVVRTIPATDRSTNGGTFKALPVIVLVTTDSITQVLTYYQRNLRGWRAAEILSTHYFWLGDSEFHPLDRSGQVTPSLEVRDARASKLVPDAQTEIHVRYKPGGGLRLPG